MVRLFALWLYISAELPSGWLISLNGGRCSGSGGPGVSGASLCFLVQTGVNW